MLEFEINSPVDTSSLEALFARAGWRESEAATKLEWILAASAEWVTCKADGEIVGFGRSCRIGRAHRVLFDVMVDEPYQGNGVEHEIIRILVSDAGGLEEVTLFSERRPCPSSFKVPETGGPEFGVGRVPLAPAGAYLGRPHVN